MDKGRIVDNLNMLDCMVSMIDISRADRDSSKALSFEENKLDAKITQMLESCQRNPTGDREFDDNVWDVASSLKRRLENSRLGSDRPLDFKESFGEVVLGDMVSRY